MATGTLMPYPVFTGWDQNGDPLVGGKLYSYLAGTTTPQATYSDAAVSVPNANPVILDSAGRATVYLLTTTSYKFVLKDALDVTIWTQDNVAAIPAPSTFGQALVTLTDGPLVSIDAALGSVFALNAAGDRTINPPTNAVDGQKIVIRHFASGGVRTLTLSTASGGFRYGTDIIALTATTANKTDYIGCIYNGSATKWDVVSYSRGY